MFTPSQISKTGQTAEWLEELCFKKSHFKCQPLSEAISCLLMSWRSVLFSWVILFYPSLALHLLLKSRTLSSAVCNSAIWPLPFLHLQFTVSRSHQFTRPKLTWCVEHCSIILYYSYEYTVFLNKKYYNEMHMITINMCNHLAYLSLRTWVVHSLLSNKWIWMLFCIDW